MQATYQGKCGAALGSRTPDLRITSRPAGQRISCCGRIWRLDSRVRTQRGHGTILVRGQLRGHAAAVADARRRPEVAGVRATPPIIRLRGSGAPTTGRTTPRGTSRAGTGLGRGRGGHLGPDPAHRAAVEGPGGDARSAVGLTRRRSTDAMIVRPRDGGSGALVVPDDHPEPRGRRDDAAARQVRRVCGR